MYVLVEEDKQRGLSHWVKHVRIVHRTLIDTNDYLLYFKISTNLLIDFS